MEHLFKYVAGHLLTDERRAILVMCYRTKMYLLHVCGIGVTKGKHIVKVVSVIIVLINYF